MKQLFDDAKGVILLTVTYMKEKLNAYRGLMADEELSDNTISKYCRDIRFFLLRNINKHTIDKKDMLEYKDFLLNRYKINTVNSYLISVNRYLSWLEAPELTVKTVRMQHKTSLEGVLAYEEYKRLLDYCLSHARTRDYLLLKTVAATGIRAGEIKFITYEAAKCGCAEIHNKGKCRMIVIPEGLSEMLLSYCAEKRIMGGVIFEGRKIGNPLGTKSVWKLFKRIAAAADIDASKVYPHNLRHLFAKTYMKKIGNIFELADILGHSNVETTRIYALSSHAEKRQSLNLLGL